MNKFQYTLSCGLRVVYEYRPSPVLYCGFVVHAGTRYEDEADEGMAHFIEHMSFKGTQRRRACHITNGLEKVGGDLNAYTTKQEVVYYATVLKDDFGRAAELLCDMVFHSTYPEREIRKEVEVICDEIDSYEDSPADLIYDDFEALMFPGQPLGRDILGSKHRLRSYTTQDARRFAERYYRPSNAVFYIYGEVNFNLAVRRLEKLLPASDFLPSIEPVDPVLSAPRLQGIERRVRKETQQLHVIVGGPTFSATDERRYALTLLNNILGGPGMNARLNVEMREKAGLVYSVNSSLNAYPDTGYWAVYFGCDVRDEKKCMKILRREIARLAETSLTAAQLNAARKQLCGQIAISTDNAENYALALGKVFAHYERLRDVPKMLERIQAVSAEELREVAREIYSPDRLSTLIYY